MRAAKVILEKLSLYHNYNQTLNINIEPKKSPKLALLPLGMEMAKPLCFCGKPARMLTSWTNNNPRRRFYGCTGQTVRFNGGFFFFFLRFVD